MGEAADAEQLGEPRLICWRISTPGRLNLDLTMQRQACNLIAGIPRPCTDGTRSRSPTFVETDGPT